MIRYVVLRVLGRTTCLWIYIDTENREVASLAGPHPVVGLATKLTHRLRQGEHQTNILIVAIGGKEIAVALIERLNLNAEGSVLLANRLAHSVLYRINEMRALALGQLIQT